MEKFKIQEGVFKLN